MPVNSIVASTAALSTRTAPALLTIGAPAAVAIVGCFCFVGVVAILSDKQIDADIANLRFTVCDGTGHFRG